MDYKKLAEMLFPDIKESVQYYEEEVFPKRNLKEGAKVTRLAPSPTGFIHLGNLYGAFVDERLAHQSEGVFMLRIEDTDEKRKVEGAVETIISSLEYFGLKFDEGAGIEGEIGNYGPYFQSNRGKIYQCVAKYLVEQGRAYPCFCTEEELEETRKKQTEENVNTGYYGKWAKDRNLTLEEVQEKLARGEEFVIRFMSMGTEEGTFEIDDAIRGHLTIHENYQDIVILKTNGIPTYHFAHVVDDHLMRVTHVVRGEEWLSTLPIHYEIFTTLGWDTPVYCHTAHLMKMDNGAKRKLSKRKDPELGLGFYMDLGYHPAAVREYLLTILNSNYEEWRIENPDSHTDNFKFALEKMSNSGALFDLDKLNNISKDVLLKFAAEDIFNFMLDWAKAHKTEITNVLSKHKEDVIKLLNVGRNGDKPRKDLMYCQQIFEFISYFFDEYFDVVDNYPENINDEEAKKLLKAYLETYDHSDDQSQWFDKIRIIAQDNGYAAKPKDYKKNPEMYKGHVGDVSSVIRIAVIGRATSPDVWELQQIMGEEKVRNRIEKAINK
ncbi:MAG: glutamate--tRNA ligase [Sedimentibacter saalensis]|jgi:glutamyl-tRNA synthetase|uniref:Glutamate--tRNA ligase n=1 Tax=Sedimentibacter saalensis TaxID=130788 RepID=A0A562JE44_9FIRM|nr:glutamate--tRNA ligase [Sedimentibacter saalensis]MEA5094796.1 glutamate--tRNA ligase [Sedimentibacter saalensis]TWH81421.1 glutamyl-tRNA synthetase [Sedimentibacter saalensis]